MTDYHDGVTGRMYCRGCCYDLTGLDEAPGVSSVRGLGSGEHACPECGRRFDSGNARSWQAYPHGRFVQGAVAALHFLGGRGGMAIAAFLIVCIAVWQTWIPRPMALDFSRIASERSWKLWHWMGKAYGEDTYNVGGYRMTMRYSAGEVVSVVRRGREGGVEWVIDDLGGQRMRLRTLVPGVEYGELIWGLRHMHEWPRYAWFFRASGRGKGYAPGEFEGTWDVLAARLMRHYEQRLLPMLRDEESTTLWVLPENGDRLTQVSVEEARAMGLAPSTTVPAPGRALRFGSR